MPTLSGLTAQVPTEAWAVLGLIVGVLAAWFTYSVPQLWAINNGWPRIYHATPYIAPIVGWVVFLLSAPLTPMTAVFGMVIIWLWVDGKLAGPGYEHGRELHAKYGEDWTEHWVQSEVPV